MRKTPEDFYNLFCDKLLKRYPKPLGKPLPFIAWGRFLFLLYNVANKLTGINYVAEESTVAELLEEWSDVFTCRLYEHVESAVADKARLEIFYWPSICNDDALLEFFDLCGEPDLMEMKR